ncbi:dihydrolipoyllysine-residue succinyltransferase [Psittacicella melopsittaci]|uniref:Dihydrolipoyllysine-residue succinyltransferase n=1 Tax=Psittacicella melopsittaci TaxID=2028576 RepID=A0A3A1Y5F5_9GAMM|nr:dihydrolipoyllysine-residue succinyltransferase [Psittacicella melopsittaci]RIY31407.1 dihydrolipoyllysine-residue succinyltransferase [Psittacicella melopsittaci]
MSIIDIKGPLLPESVANAELHQWLVEVGQQVEAGETIAVVESDKVSFEVSAPEDGFITEFVEHAGATIFTEQLIAKFQVVEASQKVEAKPAPEVTAEPTPEVKPTPVVEAKPAPTPVVEAKSAPTPVVEAKIAPAPEAKPAPATKPAREPEVVRPAALNKENDYSLAAEKVNLGPSARRLINEHGITSDEVETYLRNKLPPRVIANEIKLRQINAAVNPFKTRVPMTNIRKHIAQRLLESKNSTAMLTTFNEVDLQSIIDIRKAYGEKFQKKHNIRLGFMSFFVKAVSEAMKEFPIISACIEGDDIVYSNTTDISIAVSTERGLVTPVLRNTENKSLADIEREIAELAAKGNNNKLTIEDMTGGNFTITNGGVFGSLFSTPIINPPQSAILGMHGIKKRPVVVDDQIVIRPMMYIALSYDHRLIDGKDSVRFLVKVKELLEDPTQILLAI